MNPSLLVLMTWRMIMQEQEQAREQFQPTATDLFPFNGLLAMADINEEDLENAIQDWRNNPPDLDFILLLDAEILEED